MYSVIKNDYAVQIECQKFLDMLKIWTQTKQHQHSDTIKITRVTEILLYDKKYLM